MRNDPNEINVGPGISGIHSIAAACVTIEERTNRCARLYHAARELLRRARERRELAGLDEAQLSELRQMAKRADTAL